MSDGRGLYSVVATDEYQPSDGLGAARNKRKYSRVVWRILIVLGVLLLIALAVAVGIYFITHKSKSDKVISACDNFYQYSCGNWLSSHGLEGRDSWGTVYQLVIDNYHHLRSYMSQPPYDSDLDAVKKTKYGYAACTDVDYINRQLFSHLEEFIRLAGGWSNIGIDESETWTTDSLARDHFLGSSAFFEFSVLPDDMNSSMPVIKVCDFLLYGIYEH